MRAELDEARKELKRKPAQGAGSGEVRGRSLRAAENGFNLIVQAVDGLDGDALLDLSDRYKQRHSPAAVVLGGVEDGKVTLIANFDDTSPTGSVPPTSSRALRCSWAEAAAVVARWPGPAGRIRRSSQRRSPRPSA